MKCKNYVISVDLQLFLIFCLGNNADLKYVLFYWRNNSAFLWVVFSWNLIYPFISNKKNSTCRCIGIICWLLCTQARNLHFIKYKLLLQFSQKINGQNELCFPQRKVVGMSGQLPLNLTYLLLPIGWFHLYLCHFPSVFLK